MADPNAAPVDDPFGDLVRQGNGESDPNDPFADLVKANGGVAAPHASLGGAMARSAVRSTAPAAGGLVGAAAGAEAGAGLGAAVGALFPPAEPFTIAGGTIAGGIAGMFGGSWAIDKAQDWALRQMPDSWRDALGMDDRQQRLDEAQHPVGTFIGGMIPYAATMRPGGLGKAVLPENATALQRILANPVTGRLFGGGLMGGMELAQEAERGDVDWTKVAISTGFGVVFNQPTRLGQRISEVGAGPVRQVGEALSRYAGPSLTGPQDFRFPTIAEVGDSKVMGPGITEGVFQGTEKQDPTAEMTAQDAARVEQQVLNPQSAVPDPTAVARRMEPELFERYDALFAQRDELRNWVNSQSNPTDEMIQPLVDRRNALQAQLDEWVAKRNGYAGGPEARRLKAQIRDVQRESDEMLARRQAYLEGRGQDTSEITQARQRFMAVDEQMRDMARDEIAPAYRRAQEAIGSGTVPPPTAPADDAALVAARQKYADDPSRENLMELTRLTRGSTEQTSPTPIQVGASIDAQKATIAADVARQLVAAGRPVDEAQHAGRLLADRYATRAAMFQGKLGTPLELYRAEGADIRGPGGRRAPPAPAAPAATEPATAPPAAVAPETAPAAAAPAETPAAPANTPAETPLPKGFEGWFPGAKVNAGPIKGLTVVQFEDGKFLLDGAGLSQYEFTPPVKIPKDENSMDWLVGLERLPDRTGNEPPVAAATPGGVEAPSTPPAVSPAAPVAAVQEPAAAAAAPVRGPGPAHGFDLVVQEERTRLQKADKAERKRAKAAGEAVPERRSGDERDRLARTAAFEKDAGTALDDLKERENLSADALEDLSKIYNRQPGEHRDVALDRAWELYNQWEERIAIAKEDGEDSLVLANLRGFVQAFEADQARAAPATTVQRVFGAERAVNPVIPGTSGEGFLTPATGVPIERTFEQRRPNSSQDRLPPVIPGKDVPIGYNLIGDAVYQNETTGQRMLVTKEGRRVYQQSDANYGYKVPSYKAEFTTPRDLKVEPGQEGLPQTLIPGVEPLAGATPAKPAAPEQLKKGGNAPPPAGGLFDTEGRKQGELFQGAKGRIRFIEGQARPIITLAKTADASTFIHETGHDFFEQLMRDSEHPEAPQQIKDDVQTLYDRLGVKDRSEVTNKHHEQMADWFEQYLREGRAPSAGLANVFAQFKNWLMQIYQTIKQLGVPISDDVRQVFDRMLAEEPKPTVIAPETKRGPNLADVLTGDAKFTEPVEAAAVADRAAAEIERTVAEPPPRVANEIQAAVAQVEQAAAANAGGEVGAGATEPGQVGAGGQPAAVEPGGGGVGENGSAKLRGGDETKREGTNVPGSEQRPGAGGTAEPPLATRPATVFGSEESPLVDKAGNIRLENLTNVEDVREAMRQSARANNDFIGDRRGVVTPGQVMDLADAIGMEGAQGLVDRWVRGQAFNAEEVVALRRLAIESATDVAAKMRDAARDGAGDDAVLAYAEARDRHKMIQATLSGATAEAGRALRAFRNMTEEGGADLNEFMKQATGRTLFQMREEARLGSQYMTPEQTSKFIRDTSKRGFGRMVLEYWINGLISGPATHTTYSVGNLILAIQKAGPETAAAAGIGAIRKAFGREGETVRIGEVGAQLRAALRSGPSALQATLDSLNTGVTTMLPGETRNMAMPFQPGATLAVPAMLNEAAKASDVMGSLFGVVRGMRDAFIASDALQKARAAGEVGLFGTEYSSTGAIPNLRVGDVMLPTGTTIRLPGRGVAAIHSFFRASNYSMDLAAQAYRKASNEGLTGAAFDARVADLRQNPPPDMMARARENATELTLMGQGSEWTQKLSRLTNHEFNLPLLGPTQLLKFVDPFVHISSNVIDQSIIKRTPVGLFSSELRADLMGKNGNIAQDRAQARMLMGTAFAVTIGALAAEGLASGSGPSDPRESAMWRLAGNQAHSVRVGDFWYDTHRLGPMGMLMGIGADMYEAAHLANEGEFQKAAAHFGHAITQNILDESFMRGPADLIRAVEDSDRYGEAWIRNFASSFIPFSVGEGQEARAIDPYSREARTVVDAMRAKIPWESENLLPRRDIWGNEMPTRAALAGAGISAIYMQHVGTDPVNQEMVKLGLHPGPVARTIRGVELTPQQHDDFARIAGRMAKSRLDMMVRSPQWRTFPPESRSLVIRETVKQSREAARGAIIAKDPTIIQKAQALKHDKFKHIEAEPPDF